MNGNEISQNFRSSMIGVYNEVDDYGGLWNNKDEDEGNLFFIAKNVSLPGEIDLCRNAYSMVDDVIQSLSAYVTTSLLFYILCTMADIFEKSGSNWVCWILRVCAAVSTMKFFTKLRRNLGMKLDELVWLKFPAHIAYIFMTPITNGKLLGFILLLSNVSKMFSSFPTTSLNYFLLPKVVIIGSALVNTIWILLGESVERIKEEKDETTFEGNGFEFVCIKSDQMSECKHKAEVYHKSCSSCVFERKLTLKELPEIVFARNSLKIRFSGTTGSIEFNALDALKMVCAELLPNLPTNSLTSRQWARKQRIEELSQYHKNFDWTFTTFYKGTVTEYLIRQTADRINIDQLRQGENTLYLKCLDMFEDTLGGVGRVKLSVRIRVMSGGYFFVLLRFYMSVDELLIRVCDTRVLGNDNQRRVLREFQIREAKYGDLPDVDPNILRDISRAHRHLPIIHERFDYISVE